MENTNVNEIRPEFISAERFRAAEFATDWACGYGDVLNTRKYWQEDFSPIQHRIFSWVGKNRDRIRDLDTLEEVEELMIADGIITRDDI